MTNPKARRWRYKFKKAWSWPESVEKFISLFLVSPSLHIFCGESDLGDIRVDLHTDADVKADAFHLPFRNESFQTIVADPPWHLAYHLRPKLIREIVRVLKTGGKLIWNAPWWPNSRHLKVEEVWYAKPNTYRICPIILIAVKLPNIQRGG